MKITTKEMRDKETRKKIDRAVKKLDALLDKDTPFRRMMMRLKDK
jgi:hypothetical protein